MLVQKWGLVLVLGLDHEWVERWEKVWLEKKWEKVSD